jgi:hypothetical protein
MPFARDLFTGTLLADGDVLVAGGEQKPSYPALSSAELFDPFLNEFNEVPPPNPSSFSVMLASRFGHSAALLPSGMVMLAGGKDYTGAVQAGTEWYDPPEAPSFVGAKVALISDAPATGSSGQTVTAGSFSVINTSGHAETLSSVTMAASDPVLFSALALNATIGSTTRSASVSAPGNSVTFSYSPALPLGSGAIATLALNGTIAPKSQLSKHKHLAPSIQAATVINASGFNGAVNSSGLPIILSSVSLL